MIHFVAIDWSSLLLPFLVSLAICAGATPLVIRLAHQRRLFDHPDERRVHKYPIPRLGGIAIFLAIILATWLLFPGDSRLTGLQIGLILIFTVGLVDDLYSLPPTIKLLGQITAATAAVCFGITIGSLTNPFGGPAIVLLPGVDVFLSVIWILLLINTVNLLDGLDGLASGISGIVSISLVALSLTAIVNQPDTAQLAAVIAGAAAGFLIYNWHPAKIFMGDSGSHVLGFVLGTIAIISGGKLATATLVLALPIIDVAWAFIRRIAQGKSPFSADRGHLHHLILDLGLTQRQTVGVMYLLTAIVGSLALIFGTGGKLLLMAMVILLAIIILALLAYFRRQHLKRH